MKGNDNSSLESLKKYVRQSPYIDILEQPNVCKSFNLPFRPRIFQKEYTRRIIEYLIEHTTTASTVSKITSIPQKYFCQVKRNLEKKGLLEVVRYDRCPTTGRRNVQFLTTNIGNKKGAK